MCWFRNSKFLRVSNALSLQDTSHFIPQQKACYPADSRKQNPPYRKKSPPPQGKGPAPPAVEPTKIPSHIQSFFIHFQYSHLMEPHEGIPRRPRCSFSILPYTPRYLDENAI